MCIQLVPSYILPIIIEFEWASCRLASHFLWKVLACKFRDTALTMSALLYRLTDIPVAVVEFKQSWPFLSLQGHFTLLPERFGALIKALPQQKGVDMGEQIRRNAIGHDFSPRGLLNSGRSQYGWSVIIARGNALWKICFN